MDVPELDVNRKLDKKRPLSPLMAAAQRGYVGVARKLLKNRHHQTTLMDRRSAK